MVTFTLEKISDTTRATPGMVMEWKFEGKKKKAPPSNVISGLYRGTTVLLGSVLEGVAGVVVQPVVGAKNKGVKGATIGVGKGLLGLICKPIAGSIDMVTNTVRGIGNTPGTIYIGAKKIFKRKIKGYKVPYEYPPIRPYIPSENDDSSRQVYIGQDEEGEIYVDRDELRKALEKHGVSRRNDGDNEESKHHPNEISNIEIQNEDDFDDKKLLIILDLIRKKKLKRESKNSLISEDEFFTCRDGSSYSQSFMQMDNEGIEVFMVKPIEIQEYEDSSSIYDSDEDEEEDQYYSNSRSPHEDTKRLMSDSDNDYEVESDAQPKFKIQTLGQINNMFRPKKIRKSKKDKRDRKTREAIGMAKKIKPVKRDDDYRIPDTSSSGGFALTDQEIINRYRSVAKEVIKRVGSQILRGKINLTAVSFPIKCMGKMSHLQALSSIMCVFPCYLTASAYQTDPIERMKWFLVAMISSISASHHFEKPLNPILGET